MSGIGSSIYNASASLGRAEATIKSIVGGIIGLILIIVGIISYKYQKRLVATTGTVDSIMPNKTLKTISMHVKYYVNNVEKTGMIILKENDNKYVMGQNIDILYDSGNIESISLGSKPNFGGSYLMLGLGIGIIGFVSVNYYLTQKYKAYASYEGASSVLPSTSGIGENVIFNTLL